MHFISNVICLLQLNKPYQTNSSTWCTASFQYWLHAVCSAWSILKGLKIISLYAISFQTNYSLLIFKRAQYLYLYLELSHNAIPPVSIYSVKLYVLFFPHNKSGENVTVDSKRVPLSVELKNCATIFTNSEKKWMCLQLFINYLL